LDQVLARLPRASDPNLLVGFDTADDAGVYRLTPELALVQTVDFFTPIVDDPFTFGAIAAANSLSDVYAMGGRPLTALSILCYPGQGDLDVLTAILQGGAEKMREASCTVVGGHSVSDPEIKFGYAVTGTVHPGRVKANAGARAGDVVLLTKPLGTGVIATAAKRGLASPQHIAGMIQSMLTLNRAAAEAMEGLDVHGVTDITGFGLIGHSREMALASGVTIEIDAAAVPALPGAREAVAAGAIPGGLKNNREFASCAVEDDSRVSDLLYDPQTSGGLLITLPPAGAARLRERHPEAILVGSVQPQGAHVIRVR
jgi:selenide,water dikinase